MSWWTGGDLADVVVESDRIRLRPWHPQDADVVSAAMQDRAVHEFLVLPDPYLAADGRAWVQTVALHARAEGTALICAVEELATGRVVGGADLRLPAARGLTAAEIGYVIYRENRANGYASEACDLLARWAFTAGAPRVEIVTAVRNLASIRTARKAGFAFESIARAAVAVPAGVVDGAVFARCPEDDGSPLAPAFRPLPSGALADGVVTLRTTRPEDVTGIGETADDRESRRWSLFAGQASAAQAQQAAERAELLWLVGTVAQLTIIDQATGRYAGDISLRLTGPPGVGLIGYSIHPAFRGLGYTARALHLVRNWAFAPVEGRRAFVRLELGAKVGNIASQRAARSGGFADDGIRRARLRNGNEYLASETLGGESFSDEICFVALAPPLH